MTHGEVTPEGERIADAFERLLDGLDRFIERAHKISKARALSPLQKKLEAAMQKAFRAQGREFVKRFAKLRGKWTAKEAADPEGATGGEPEQPEMVSIDDDDWFPIFEDAADETADMFSAPLVEMVGAALALGAGSLDLGAEIMAMFDLSNPRAVAYLAEHGAELVKVLEQTTRDYIKTVVVEGAENGWSYDEIAKRITERFEEFAVGKPQQHIDSRAHLVAVTELGNAYEEGNYIVIQDLKDKGLEMEKKWSTMGDDRVSDECAQNEADGWIPADETHTSGHMHPLRFPGCRCDELYRVVTQED